MKQFLTTAFIVAVFFAQAQDKQVKFEGAATYVGDYIFFGESGIVFSSLDRSKKTNILRYYNTDLDLVWQKDVEAKYSARGRDDSYNTSYDMREGFIVGTPSGSVVYQVEMKPDDVYQKEHYITQITKGGDLKKFAIDGREELGRSLQTVFCDEQYFYLLATDNGNEDREKKKTTEKLILNRFDAKTFVYKRIVLDLPVVEAGDNTTFWAYAGQNATEKILVSKNIDSDNEKLVVSCAAFDQEGKVTRTWKLEPKIEGEFFRPARNVADPDRSFHQVSNFDFFVVQSKSQATNITYQEPRIDYDAFCSFVYDESSDAFYVYGLMGPKAFKKIASVYDGFYIFKYDSKGTLQWKTQQKAPKTLADYGAFRIHSTPELRNIGLRFTKDNSVNFLIQTKKLLGVFSLNSEGKLARTAFDSDFTASTTGLYLPLSTSKAEAYVKKFASKKRPPDFYLFALPDRDILVEKTFDEADQLLLFKK